MSLGGQITEDDLQRYATAIGNASMPTPVPYVDQTALAQQAILARPMSQSFMGQPIMSRDVPRVQSEYSGLIYPEMIRAPIAVPNFTTSWRGNSNSGGDGGLGDGGYSQDIGVGSNFGNTQDQDDADNGPAAATNDATDTADQDDADQGGGGDGGGDSKIICTAMNHTYGFGSFRNAIWLKYSESKLTKAHEVGYHTLFLPMVDFGFKRGDGKANLMVRKFLESCARHRSLDLRAEMRGTKRDKVGMIYRLIFEPLCYAVGKLKGY